MEEYSYTSTHPLDHTGPVTGSLYLIAYKLTYTVALIQAVSIINILCFTQILFN